MPSLQVVQALTANQRGYNPIANWKYRYAPYRAAVRLGINTTGASGSVNGEVTVGSDAVVQRGPVSSGGTAGVMPAPLNVPYFEFIVGAGDLIDIAIDELAAATPTVNVHITIDPV